MRFGFDVSGVLCDMKDLAKPEALEVVQKLKKLGHGVFCISGGRKFCDYRRKFVLQDFVDVGFEFDGEVWLERFKSAACAELNLNMYVDDDPVNLSHLEPPTQGVYLRPSGDGGLEVPSGVAVVNDWPGVKQAITRLSGVMF